MPPELLQPDPPLSPLSHRAGGSKSRPNYSWHAVAYCRAGVTISSAHSPAATDGSALLSLSTSHSDTLVGALVLVCHVDGSDANTVVRWFHVITRFVSVTLGSPSTKIRIPTPPPQTLQIPATFFVIHRYVPIFIGEPFPHIFDFFFPQFFNLPYFPDFFFPNVLNLTNLIFLLFLIISRILTERLRILIRISHYFQTLEIMEKTIPDKNEPVDVSMGSVRGSSGSVHRLSMYT